MELDKVVNVVNRKPDGAIDVRNWKGQGYIGRFTYGQLVDQYCYSHNCNSVSDDALLSFYSKRGLTLE